VFCSKSKRWNDETSGGFKQMPSGLTFSPLSSATTYGGTRKCHRQRRCQQHTRASSTGSSLIRKGAVLLVGTSKFSEIRKTVKMRRAYIFHGRPHGLTIVCRSGQKLVGLWFTTTCTAGRAHRDNVAWVGNFSFTGAYPPLRRSPTPNFLLDHQQQKFREAGQRQGRELRVHSALSSGAKLRRR
jgi:hypothetical protein